jgi:glutamate-5-semialdehyde dehydrogenase
MNEKNEAVELARHARQASRTVATLTTKVKNLALEKMADSLEDSLDSILQANARDVEAGRGKGLSSALIDRLTLNRKRVEGMAASLRDIINLPDPVGEISEVRKRENGLEVGRMRVPLGVVAMIYEARPNVTSDAAGLCLKSGNAVILKGGSEAINSNMAIADVLSAAIEQAGVPKDAILLVRSTDRKLVQELLRLDEYIDVIIPRGGEGLIRSVVEQASIPVIKHYKGVCHTYIDSDAEIPMAMDIAVNAKVQRPGVCNAMETLLVHEKIAPEILPELAKRLQNAGVELRGCPRTGAIVPGINEATEEDWPTEYLDLILAIKVVDNIDNAMEHIARYGSQHSEAIVTANYKNALRFQREVDSSAVFVNSSTRFNDGGEFGLGAEIGISTQKLHARGPMGLKELTCTKFIINGNGQIRT